MNNSIEAKMNMYNDRTTTMMNKRYKTNIIKYHYPYRCQLTAYYNFGHSTVLIVSINQQQYQITTNKFA